MFRHYSAYSAHVNTLLAFPEMLYRLCIDGDVHVQPPPTHPLRLYVQQTTAWLVVVVSSSLII